MNSFFEKLKGLEPAEEAMSEIQSEEKVAPEKPKKKTRKTKEKPLEEKPKEWPEPEGQLAVDVYQTDSYIIIRSPIAGVTKEALDIAIENDIVIIRGRRDLPPDSEEKQYFCQECYWGAFSREIILPSEGDASRADASMKEGVLTIKIPRIKREKIKKINIKG